MNETASSNDNVKSIKSKSLPTLLASESKIMTQSDDRILASLDGRASDNTTSNQPANSKTRFLLLSLLLSLLGVAAWLYVSNFTNDRSNRNSTPSSQISSATAVEQRPAVIASNTATNSANNPSATPGVEAAPAPTAAIIVNEPSSKTAATVSDGTESKQGKEELAPTPARVAVASSAGKSARQSSDPIQELIERTEKSSKNARSGPVASSAMKMRGGQPGEMATSPATVSTSGRNDSDIDLLTALFAHGDSKPAQRTQSSAIAGNTSTAKASDSSKDIVLASQGSSTEELVKRCRTLGWLEGELCRYRICSNLWGKDAACPAPASTATSTSAYR